MKCDNCQEPVKRRTSQQNRALHKYFALLAEALNESGYDMRETIREEVDIPWTANTIKEHVWRPVQKAYLREQSTTRLKTKDIDKVYDIVNKMVGERTGVTVPFPSIEQLLMDERINDV